MTVSGAPQGRIALGILFAVAAFFCFATADNAIKWISGEHHPIQSLFINVFFAYVPVLGFILATEGRIRLKPRFPVLTPLRGAAVTVSAMCIVTAISTMPTADAYALLFSMPLWVTILAGPLLGERVGIMRWSAVLVGFIGVLAILRPGFADVGWGHGLALLAALAFACGVLITRRIGNQEGTGPLLVWLLVSTQVICLPFVIALWEAPDWHGLAFMAISGVAAGFAQIFVVLAYRQAPAVVVSPFIYTQLIWGAIYGLILFGETPGWPVIAGAAVVVASGLFILYRETRARG
ncbi:MAG: DMT family transporter [Azospirillaceae bacterium]